jgi:hypothetical protein
LLSQDSEWQAAFQRTENAMCTRAEPAAAGAWKAIQDTFSEDGLAHTLQVMEEQSEIERLIL